MSHSRPWRWSLAFLPFLAAACESPAPSSAAGSPSPAPAPAPALAPAPLPPLAPELAALAAGLELDLATHHLPGFALAIVKDDRLIFARGFGLAEVEAARPATPETIFAIGSTTKAFTATLAEMLAEEGKLSLDDPVAKHLPWFTLPIQGQGPVTLRDLLAHRTGFARMDVLWAGGKASAEEVLRTAVRAEPLAPFRSRFLYNNIMFLAAGEACAAAAGKGWEELVRERFFVPLGMDATTTSVAEAQRDPRLALGYDWDEHAQRFERKPMRSLHSIAPAGAINSNVLDLARWLRFLLAGGELDGRRLIAAQRLAETWQPHNDVQGELRYGLGWMLSAWNGEPVIQHDGSIDGFGASIWLLPGRKTGLVMLANVSRTPLQAAIGPRVFEALYGAPAAVAADGGASGDDLARYAGTYIASFFQFHEAEFEVLVQDGKLAVDVPGQMAFELLPPDEHGRRAFALVPDQIQASFVEAGGAVVAMEIRQGGFAFECLRAGYEPPSEREPEEYLPYLGSYADPLTGKTMAVVVSHGRLAVDYPEQMVYELRPPDEGGKWVFRASDQFAVQFQLDADGRAESLTFHERGTQRACERVDGGQALPALDELLALRRAPDFETRLAELGRCRLEAGLRLVHCGIQGTNTTTFDASGRYREETDLEPFVSTTTVFDGQRVRYESSLSGSEELFHENRDQASAGSPAVLFGDWRTRFDEARVVRTGTEGGRRTAVVRLRKGTAPPMLVHVDAASGDLVRAEVQELVEGLGSLPKTVTFEDWREVEGLRLPMRVISEDEATGRVVSAFRGLETRLAPADDPFALPGASPR